MTDESVDQTNGTAPPPGDPPSPPLQVNSQIIDAVKKSTAFAFGLENKLQAPMDGGTRLSSGAAIAYEKAAQAAALAIQDSVDYQRNVLSISNVAQGKALATMFADESKIPQCAIILALALASSLAAAITVGEIGTQVNKMIQGFPRA
jgi:hypothetical protein